MTEESPGPAWADRMEVIRVRAGGFVDLIADGQVLETQTFTPGEEVEVFVMNGDVRWPIWRRRLP